VRRATTLLEDQPESAAHGYLELQLERGAAQFDRGSIDEAMEHATRVHEIGKRFGDRDLQAYGLALQGWILVMKAQVELGLSLVDEAAVAAVAGELTPFAAGGIYCLTIGVCRTVADYRRPASGPTPRRAGAIVSPSPGFPASAACTARRSCGCEERSPTPRPKRVWRSRT
jgi:hypothetical protein